MSPGDLSVCHGGCAAHRIGVVLARMTGLASEGKVHVDLDQTFTHDAPAQPPPNHSAIGSA
jgi:hypothetical protein